MALVCLSSFGNAVFVVQACGKVSMMSRDDVCAPFWFKAQVVANFCPKLTLVSLPPKNLGLTLWQGVNPVRHRRMVGPPHRGQCRRNALRHMISGPAGPTCLPVIQISSQLYKQCGALAPQESGPCMKKIVRSCWRSLDRPWMACSSTLCWKPSGSRRTRSEHQDEVSSPFLIKHVFHCVTTLGNVSPSVQ